jgi:hypothetical protein
MKQYTHAFSVRIHTRHALKYRIHSDMKRVPRKATLFYREIQCSFFMGNLSFLGPCNISCIVGMLNLL